jgi:hypothetical protein
MMKHSHILVAFLAMLWFAPVGFVALAALLVFSPPIGGVSAIIAVVAGGVSLSWLGQAGVLPEQVLRAGTVIAVAVFVPVTFYTRASLGHRVILASAAAATSVTLLLGAFGRSLHELRWWVEYRVGYAMRVFTGAVLGGNGSDTIDKAQLTEFTSTFVRFMADYDPARAALEVMAGLALASVIYYRLAKQPRGIPPGRFRDFRFTEHLGWAAIAMLVVVLVPKLAAAKLGAMNVLLVLGSLFALRGTAVATVAFYAFGGGWLNAMLTFALTFFLLPVALIGAIVLGIVDTRFDLRKRWDAPRPGG